MSESPQASSDAGQLTPGAVTVTEQWGLAGLDRLESDWRRIYSEMPWRTGFHAFDAHRAFVLRMMAEPDKLRCLAVAVDGVVCAICPLQPATTERTLLGLPIPVWRVSEPPHYPPGDVICARDDVRRSLIPALVHHLRRNPEGPRRLVLGPAPADSPLWDGLGDLTTAEYATTPTMPAYVFDCTRPFEELMAGMSRDYRRSLGRRRRKLDSLADVQFVTVTDKAGLATQLESFFDLEASGWKGVRGPGKAIRLREGQPGFWHDLFTNMEGEDDRCEINVLYAEGHPIASLLCMRTGREYSSLKTAYDERYHWGAPGMVLIQHTLERCCKDPGIARFNTVGDAAWIVPWRPDSVIMKKAYVALGRWSGPPLVAVLRLRFGYGRRVVHWLRDKRRTRVEDPKGVAAHPPE
jgi:Acetyltransferase (GNAT) domain